MRYYLVDGIYPEWMTLVNTITRSQGDERKLFAQHQEATRKDVECTFGVLQSQLAIVCDLACAWEMNPIKHILYVCILLHNMIVKDE